MPRQATHRAKSASLILSALMLAAGLAGCGRPETSATLLAEAKQYQQKGDDAGALIQLKNAASTSPQDAEVRFQLASLYNLTGNPVSAEKEIRLAASLGLAAERTRPELARALFDQGLYQKLLDELNVDPRTPSAALLASRGEAYLALNQPAAAKAAFEQALALEPGRPAALIGMARYSMQQKDRDGANRHIDQAIAKNPNDTDVLMFKAALLRSDNKSAEAMALYDKVLALKPRHVMARVDRANVQISLGKYDAALAELDAARKIAPNNLLVTYNQGLLDVAQGKYAAAQDSILKVLRVAPEHMPSILLAGVAESHLGAVQQAEQHLKKYLEAYPSDLYARKTLAQVQLKSAQPDEATATLAPALQDATNDPQLLSLAGQAQMQARQFDKAAGYFSKASELEPDAELLHTSLGISKLGQDPGLAIRELEKGAALNPKSFTAGAALVQAELALKHHDKALAAAEALEKQHGDQARTYNLIGGVHISKGDAAKARANFDKALSLDPANLRAATSLAYLDLQEKKPEAAARRFEAMLARDKKNIGAMMALSEIAARQGKADQAISWLERASTENPQALAPAMKLASSYLATSQPEKALTLARKYQTANPTNPELLDMLGQIQISTGNGAAALETYSKLINTLPKSAPAQYRLASAHLLLKNEAAATADLKKAAALQPDFLPAQLGLFQLAIKGKRSADALAIARGVQKLPQGARIGAVLEADTLAAEQKFDQALPVYQKAFALEPSSQLMIAIHRLMTQTGKEQEAAKWLANWQKEHPADPTVAMYVAETNMGKKQYALAIGQFEAILKESPNNAVVLNNLALCYLEERNPKALPIAERAFKIAGNNPAITDTLATALTEQGNTARSIALHRKAVAMAPDQAEMRYHLASALAKSGDKQGARKELEMIIAVGKTSPQFEAARELLKRL